MVTLAMKVKILGSMLVIGGDGKIVPGREAIRLGCGHVVICSAINAFQPGDRVECNKDHDPEILKRLETESKIDWAALARKERDQ